MQYLDSSNALAQGVKNETKANCFEGVSFIIGEVDSKFEITTGQLGEIISTVDLEWRKFANKNLISEGKERTIKINLVYNENSERAENSYKLKQEIDERQKRIDQKSIAYNHSFFNYSKKNQVLKIELEAFKKESKKFSGIKDYSDIRRQEFLKSKLVEKEREILNQEKILQNTYNDIYEMKKSKDSLLLNYSKYAGNIGAVTIGQYERNDIEEKIDIFFYKDLEQLKSILLHEFGHALGIKHINQFNSIMHHEIKIDDRFRRELLAIDIDKLKEICDSGQDNRGKVIN